MIAPVLIIGGVVLAALLWPKRRTTRKVGGGYLFPGQEFPDEGAAAEYIEENAGNLSPEEAELALVQDLPLSPPTQNELFNRAQPVLGYEYAARVWSLKKDLLRFLRENLGVAAAEGGSVALATAISRLGETRESTLAALDWATGGVPQMLTEAVASLPGNAVMRVAFCH